jgi:hypothetical protein
VKSWFQPVFGPTESKRWNGFDARTEARSHRSDGIHGQSCAVVRFEFFDLSAMLPRARPRLMHSREMPLFPYLPVIVWMGMIKVMLGATLDNDAQSTTDPTDPTMNRASIIPFPAPRAVAIIG